MNTQSTDVDTLSFPRASPTFTSTSTSASTSASASTSYSLLCTNNPPLSTPTTSIHIHFSIPISPSCPSIPHNNPQNPTIDPKKPDRRPKQPRDKHTLSQKLKSIPNTQPNRLSTHPCHQRRNTHPPIFPETASGQVQRQENKVPEEVLRRTDFIEGYEGQGLCEEGGWEVMRGCC